MKTIIIYYSLTGKTKKLAESLAKKLKSDIEEITEKKRKRGLFKSGFEAALKLKPRILPLKSDLSKYDLVVIGTPIWAGNMSSPVRSFLSKYKDKISKSAFFCTHGGGGKGKAFKEMRDICGNPLSVLQADKNTDERCINEFIDQLKQG